MAERPRCVPCREPAGEGGRLVEEALRSVLAERDFVRLAIPGGSALAALRGTRDRLGGSWRRVRLTWVDERCVPFASPASNRGAAYRDGVLDPAQPPGAELPLFLDGERGDEAVARVAAGLAAQFEGGLDVALLGIGEDGHVASLFPGAAAPPPGTGVVYVEASPKPPPRRITLTRALLATAQTSVLVAGGEAKRRALERLLAGDATLPAHGLPGLTVVTDLALGAAR